MKIQVAYDLDGRILAAAPQAGTKSGMHVGAQPGSEVADLDVPAEFEGKHLREFLHLLRVDAVGKRLVRP
jgi:hypothetical protein